MHVQDKQKITDLFLTLFQYEFEILPEERSSDYQ